MLQVQVAGTSVALDKENSSTMTTGSVEVGMPSPVAWPRSCPFLLERERNSVSSCTTLGPPRDLKPWGKEGRGGEEEEERGRGGGGEGKRRRRRGGEEEEERGRGGGGEGERRRRRGGEEEEERGRGERRRRGVVCMSGLHEVFWLQYRPHMLWRLAPTA